MYISKLIIYETKYVVMLAKTNTLNIKSNLSHINISLNFENNKTNILQIYTKRR